MNYRINTRIVALVTLLVVIAIGLFVYTLVSAPTKDEVYVAPPVAETPEILITAKHQFKDGVHTIVGTATVPTPCHRIDASPFFLEDGNIVEVRLSTLIEGEACQSQEFDAPFRATWNSGPDVEIRATWNGTPARLNLIEVGPEESIEDDIYIKG